MKKMRTIAIGLAVVALGVVGIAPAFAANPYNALGYMNVVGDYAGVKVVNAGAGVLKVEATLVYTAPGSGALTYTTGVHTDTTPEAGIPVTSGQPDTGLQYTNVTKFRGCSGTSSCSLGGWDTNASLHNFS